MQIWTSRRDHLKLGLSSVLGVAWPQLMAMSRCAANQNRPAKACILIWLDGGPSHLEMFDPKPDAPAEVRGPMDSIATTLAGVRLGECLERTAAMMDHVALVRSVTSPLGEHNFGTHYVLTGYRPSPALEYPAIGATLTHLRASDAILPPHIAVPRFSDNISGHGFLPADAAPFAVGGDPERGELRVADLDPYAGVDLTRISRRRDMVAAMNALARGGAIGGGVASGSLDRAYDLMASREAKEAFDLLQESDATRDLYGRSGGSGIGPSCLLARRLVERGVPFVTVHSGGWDTHQDIMSLKSRYPGDRSAHLPSFDRAFSGLIEDLQQRGMLAETLVLVMGEFGRTPKVNPAAGRDHWPNVFSVAMAGGGIRGGQVVGSSDSLGEFPKDRPVTPSDLIATIYTLLGIDPATELRTADGRPVRVAPDDAAVIAELLA